MLNETTLQYIRAIYRQRKLVIAVTALAFLASLGKELLKGNQYTSETTLVVTTVPFKEAEPRVPGAMNPKAYESLAESMDVIGQLLARLDKEKAFPDGTPEIRDFLRMLRATTITVDPTTRPVNYAPLLVLGATAENAVLAQTIANAWADIMIDVAHRANMMQISAAKEVLGKQKASQQAILDTIWIKQSEEESLWDVDLMRLELEKRQELIVDQEKQLASTQVSLKGAEQQLVAAQEKLKTEPEIKELFKSPADTAWWIVTSENKGDAVKADLEKKGMVSQELNPNYVTLTGEINKNLQQVAGFKASLDQLTLEIERLRKQQAEVQANLAKHELAQTRLDTEEEYMKSSLVEIAQLDLSLDAGNNMATIKSDAGIAPVGLNRLSDETYVPEQPGMLGRKGRVLASTVLGFLLAVGYAVSGIVIAPVMKLVKQ
ncbi:MAG: hypothetical protein HZB26_06840 [Candidatus Hydrogenedentes bacterium]|nr:hypothetical protein [Candidatus Hydrogenedentota bacterium]